MNSVSSYRHAAVLSRAPEGRLSTNYSFSQASFVGPRSRWNFAVCHSSCHPLRIDVVPTSSLYDSHRRGHANTVVSDTSRMPDSLSSDEQLPCPTLATSLKPRSLISQHQSPDPDPQTHPHPHPSSSSPPDQACSSPSASHSSACPADSSSTSAC